MDMLSRIARRIASDQSSIDRLKEYQNDANVLMHFSDIGGDGGFKLGINPLSDFDTPIGVYGYPITSRTLMKAANGSLPFAGGRSWTYAYELQGHIIHIDQNGGSPAYTSSDLEQDIEWLREEYPEKYWDSYIDYGRNRGRIHTPIGQLWTLTQTLSEHLESYDQGESARQWNNVLRELGIDGIIDHGSSLIHPNEPYQGVALSTHQTDVLDVVQNPFQDKSEQIENQEEASAYDLAANVIGDVSAKETIALILGNPPTRHKRQSFIKDVRRWLQKNHDLQYLILHLDDATWVRLSSAHGGKIQGGDFVGMEFAPDLNLTHTLEGSWFKRCEFHLSGSLLDMEIDGTMGLEDTVIYADARDIPSDSPQTFAQNHPIDTLEALGIGMDDHPPTVDVKLRIGTDDVNLTSDNSIL
jgi:hypothetical protein